MLALWVGTPRKQMNQLGGMVLNLVRNGNGLFAFADNVCKAKIINEISGECRPMKISDEPGVFANIFGGHGTIIHQSSPPPNPFFVNDWGDVFSNPALLPKGTKNVFLDEEAAKEYYYKATQNE